MISWYVLAENPLSGYNMYDSVKYFEFMAVGAIFFYFFFNKEHKNLAM